MNGDRSSVECYKCHKRGHIAANCPTNANAADVQDRTPAFTLEDFMPAKSTVPRREAKAKKGPAVTTNAFDALAEVEPQKVSTKTVTVPSALATGGPQATEGRGRGICDLKETKEKGVRPPPQGVSAVTHPNHKGSINGAWLPMIATLLQPESQRKDPSCGRANTRVRNALEWPQLNGQKRAGHCGQESPQATSAFTCSSSTTQHHTPHHTIHT